VEVIPSDEKRKIAVARGQSTPGCRRDEDCQDGGGKKCRKVKGWERGRGTKKTKIAPSMDRSRTALFVGKLQKEGSKRGQGMRCEREGR